MARTVSVPQRSGTLSDPLLYETLSRMIVAINSALTVAMAPSIPTSPSGTISPTNPVTRLIGPGTIRTIGAVDFDFPIYLIASTSDVGLETGGNIGAAATIRAGTAGALVQDKTNGIWWPIVGGGDGVVPYAEEELSAGWSISPAASTTLVRVSNGAVAAITGGADGRRLTLVNDTSGSWGPLELYHERALSVAQDRLNLPQSGNLIMGRRDAVDLVYSGASSRWVCSGTTATIGGSVFLLEDPAGGTVITGTNVTVTLAAGRSLVMLTPNAPGRSVSTMVKATGDYVTDELVYVENGSAADTLTVNHGAGADNFNMPSGVNLSLLPLRVAIFRRTAGYWRQVTVA